MKTIIAICIALALSACAPVQQRPVYTHDDALLACQQQASAGTVQSAAAGAIAGAVFGALLARSTGLHGHYVANVAATGAASGAAQGFIYGSVEWQAYVDSCMAARGYNP